MGGSTLHSTYDYPLVALSVLIAIAASYAALTLAERVSMARNQARTAWLFGGAVVMGTVVIAWVVSLVALGLIKMNLVLDSANDGQPDTSSQVPVEKSSKLLKAVASVTMGIAIPIMHYTAMAAVSYQSMPGSPDLSFSMEISALGYIAIIVIALVVLTSICLLRWWPTLVELPPQLHAKDGVADKSPT